MVRQGFHANTKLNSVYNGDIEEKNKREIAMYKTASNKHKNSRHSSYDIVGDIERIKSAFSDAAHDVRGRTGEMLTESVDHLKDQSVKLRDDVTDYIAEKPLKSVGIALVTGMVIGFLLRR